MPITARLADPLMAPVTGPSGQWSPCEYCAMARFRSEDAKAATNCIRLQCSGWLSRLSDHFLSNKWRRSRVGAGCYFWSLSRCGAVTLNSDRTITGKMAADWRRGQEVVRGHLPWFRGRTAASSKRPLKWIILFTGVSACD